MLRRPMDAELANGLPNWTRSMSKKLAAVGLIPKREAKRLNARRTPDELLPPADRREDQYARHTGGRPRECCWPFSMPAAVGSITAGEARDFERWLKTGDARANRYAGRKSKDGLAPNTIRKRISDAKQFFQDAVQRELLTRNPFVALQGDRRRQPGAATTLSTARPRPKSSPLARTPNGVCCSL